ncbi:hypothetical protein L596_030317 [Steinernema carpocapsae]|uniref:Uncharacterized protein n=1 Tax=Steinernema carpocapsae TaxID=34508 RepID=A0A4U5LP20_STECR|nr:hypothetical protein L596_030317 [Steinernema carpocapsae]
MLWHIEVLNYISYRTTVFPDRIKAPPLLLTKTLRHAIRFCSSEKQFSHKIRATLIIGRETFDLFSDE